MDMGICQPGVSGAPDDRAVQNGKKAARSGEALSMHKSEHDGAAEHGKESFKHVPCELADKTHVGDVHEQSPIN